MSLRPIRRGAGGRLSKARESMGYTQKQLAELAEIPVPTLKDYEGGNSIPGGEALAKLAFIGFNLEYVFWGEGDPVTRKTDGAYRAATASPGLKVAQTGAGYVTVPLYDVRVAAGKGAPVAHVEPRVTELAFREEWIRSTLHVSPSDLTLVHVEGDSMDPDLRAGDIILVDHTDTAARREGVYVIRMEDALLVKRVQRKPGGVLRLVSANPAYEPIQVPVPDIEPGGKVAIIGRVVWACRRV